ncbi:MAG: T9SS type A sorting domain-containing protein, partial [Bacteroidetes bacterium]|nr:T9SS type A sorting domain-containing protein [Bacteroidota bacterium]
KIKAAGIANITAISEGNSNYFKATNVTQQLVIKPALQSITFQNLEDKKYGDADFDPEATASSGLPVQYISDNIQVAIIQNGKVHIVGAGTVNIFALQQGNSLYYPAIAVSRTLKVNKATQTLSFAPIPVKSFGDQPFTPDASSSVGLPVEFSTDNSNVAVVVDNKIYMVGIGIANITASQGGSSNYLGAVAAKQMLIVKKASQNIVFNPLSNKVYGDADFSPDATVNSDMKITFSSSNSAVATIVNNKIHIVGAGTTSILANQSGDEYYNAAFQRSQVLTVAKVNQTISFKPLPNVKAGSPDFILEATSTSGLPVTFSGDNNYVASINNGVVHLNGQGYVTITASQEGDNNFNSAPSVSHVLFVDKLSQIIVFDTIPAKKYGDSDFDPGAIASSGLPISYTSDNQTVAKIINGKVHIVSAGTAKITASQGGNQNYKSAEQSVTRMLVVNKALITVKAENSQRAFQQANPLFNIQYSGFVFNEDKNVIDVHPVVQTTATTASFPGLFELTPTGGQDGNYNFVYEKGILVIMGTYPLKPAKPEGKEVFCVNPGSQTYTTSGSIFATSYIWKVIPSDAGVISASSKNITINFREDFIGKVSISVKGQNSYGISESSDTFFVNIIPAPVPSVLSLNGSYCSNNPLGDTIQINNSQNYYRYQLLKEGMAVGTILEGNGGKLAWSGILQGKYSIEEKVCNTITADDIVVKEVNPSTVKPVIEKMWNDVLVCIQSGDTVKQYQWFRDGELLVEEKKQYLWTQKVPGVYAVLTTDKNRCEFSSEEIELLAENIGIIYPNPNKGEFKVSFTNTETGKVTIKISGMNSISVKTYSFSKTEDLFEKELNIPDLKTGIYFIDIILNGKRVFYEKLIRD